MQKSARDVIDPNLIVHQILSQLHQQLSELFIFSLFLLLIFFSPFETFESENFLFSSSRTLQKTNGSSWYFLSFFLSEERLWRERGDEVINLWVNPCSSVFNLDVNLSLLPPLSSPLSLSFPFWVNFSLYFLIQGYIRMMKSWKVQLFHSKYFSSLSSNSQRKSVVWFSLPSRFSSVPLFLTFHIFLSSLTFSHLTLSSHFSYLSLSHFSHLFLVPHFSSSIIRHGEPCMILILFFSPQLSSPTNFSLHIVLSFSLLLRPIQWHVLHRAYFFSFLVASFLSLFSITLSFFLSLSWSKVWNLRTKYASILNFSVSKKSVSHSLDWITEMILSSNLCTDK